MKIRKVFNLQGRVQGVGFRPFVYRLACELSLSGFVKNTKKGVQIEVEGLLTSVDAFSSRLSSELPRNASLRKNESWQIELQNDHEFSILTSSVVAVPDGESDAEILPDLATCGKCCLEIFDPKNRRFQYPFTNCTECGPRYSIIKALPYDRANTSMGEFKMCDSCQAEYDDPSDRRFHAEPNACPECGPSLTLIDGGGGVVSTREQALLGVVDALNAGQILAIQGIGGFHLVCDAGANKTVQRLRERKKRESKPFAVMIASVSEVRALCALSDVESRMLASVGAPIVLLNRVGEYRFIADTVAPGLSTLGVLLPYTPLHHLIMKAFGRPLVVTSANIADEPICFEKSEALRVLFGVADGFLVHDRKIVSRVDDSVVREISGQETVFRAGRGYAPLKLELGLKVPGNFIIGLGGQEKNTLSLLNNRYINLMPHFGNLDSVNARDDYETGLSKAVENFGADRVQFACDRHPEYFTSQILESREWVGLTRVLVQHHHAHVLSCLVDNELALGLAREKAEAVFGVAWDGSGYGLDGSIWGGEFLVVHSQGFEHVGSLRQFALPGGEKAVKEPRLSAVSMMRELACGDLDRFLALCSRFGHGLSDHDLVLIHTMIEKKINSPLTSSVGRLFDGVAALLGVVQVSRYEGEAAMRIEALAAQVLLAGGDLPRPYSVSIGTDGTVDWGSFIQEVIKDQELGVHVSEISLKFHLTLAHAIGVMAQRSKVSRILLTGGCFQNRVLSELAIDRLQQMGFAAYWHHRVPPNDGGLSVGQAASRAFGCSVG